MFIELVVVPLMAQAGGRKASGGVIGVVIWVVVAAMPIASINRRSSSFRSSIQPGSMTSFLARSAKYCGVFKISGFGLLTTWFHAVKSDPLLFRPALARERFLDSQQVRLMRR